MTCCDPSGRRQARRATTATRGDIGGGGRPGGLELTVAGRTAAGQSELTTVRNAVFTATPSEQSINPSRSNFFMKTFTRERVVPTISANVSCVIGAIILGGSSGASGSDVS